MERGTWQVHLLVCEDALHLREEAQLSHGRALLLVGLPVSPSCCLHLAEEAVHQGVQVCGSSFPVDNTHSVRSAALDGHGNAVLQQVVQHCRSRSGSTQPVLHSRVRRCAVAVLFVSGAYDMSAGVTARRLPQWR